MNQIFKNRLVLMVIAILVAIMGLFALLSSIPYSTYSSTIIVIDYPSSSDSYIAGESVSIRVTFNPQIASGLNPTCTGYQILYKETFLYEEGSTEVVLVENVVSRTGSSFTIITSFIPSEYARYTIRAGMLVSHERPVEDGDDPYVPPNGDDTYAFSTLLDLLTGSDEIEYYNQVTIIDSQVTVLVTTETVVTTVIPEPVTIVTTVPTTVVTTFTEEGEVITSTIISTVVSTIVTTIDRTVVETLLITIEKSVTSYEPSFGIIVVFITIVPLIIFKRRKQDKQRRRMS